MSRRPDTAPAVVFAALGDGTRLRLIQRLSAEVPRSITELSRHSALTRQAITKHLRVLEAAGLVQSVRRGREMRFTFNSAPLGRARNYLDEVLRQWDDALERLRALVETGAPSPAAQRRKR